MVDQKTRSELNDQSSKEEVPENVGGHAVDGSNVEVNILFWVAAKIRIELTFFR